MFANCYILNIIADLYLSFTFRVEFLHKEIESLSQKYNISSLYFGSLMI